MAERKGAGTIVYTDDTKRPFVLIGDESVLEFERVTAAGITTYDPPSITIRGVVTDARTLQSFAGAESDEGKRAARTDFSKKARDIEVVRGYRVQFTQPVFIKGRWKTQFQKLVPGFKTGIPKGGRERHETPFENASREMSEEIGIGLHEDRDRPFADFSCKNYIIFQYPLLVGEQSAIEATLADRMAERYSELFNPRFMELDAILDAHKDGRLRLNRVSELALRQFKTNLLGAPFLMPPRGGKSRRSKKGQKSKKSKKSKKNRRN